MSNTILVLCQVWSQRGLHFPLRFSTHVVYLLTGDTRIEDGRTDGRTVLYGGPDATSNRGGRRRQCVRHSVDKRRRGIDSQSAYPAEKTIMGVSSDRAAAAEERKHTYGTLGKRAKDASSLSKFSIWRGTQKMRKLRFDATSFFGAATLLRGDIPPRPPL